MPGPPPSWSVREGLVSRFHEDLSTLLRDRGWRAADLARATGISQPTLSGYLRWGKWPSAASLERLAVVLAAPAEASDRWRSEIAGRAVARATAPPRRWVQAPPHLPCLCGCGGTPRTRQGRHLPGHHNRL